MAYVLPSINLSDFKEIIDIMNIIDIICKIVYGPKSNMPCSEYDIFVLRVWDIHVPYHPVVLRAHQNHFCLRVRRRDRGFQIDERETRTETLQTCQAEQRECHTSPTCQHFPAWFCGNQGHRIPHAGPRRPPICARCDDVPVVQWKIMKLMYIMNILRII